MGSIRRTTLRTLAAYLILALSAPFALAEGPALPTKGSARVRGRVFRLDGKTPIENAVVRTCFLQNGMSLASSPTGAKGEFSIDSLPSGYADIAIETPDGVFVANQVLQFVPGQRDSVDFVLTRYTERPAEWWGNQEKRQVPCTSGEPSGTADIRTDASSAGFFKSTAGIVTLTGAGVLLILLLVSGGGGNDEPAASPTVP